VRRPRADCRRGFGEAFQQAPVFELMPRRPARRGIVVSTFSRRQRRCDRADDKVIKAEKKRAVANLVDVEKPAGLAEVVGSDRYRNGRRKPGHTEPRTRR
jgi:hypothetical protein